MGSLCDQVTKEDAKQAMLEQYGGQDEPAAGFGSNYRAAAKFSNAYMLVYIRESDWSDIMCEVGGNMPSPQDHLETCQKSSHLPSLLQRYQRQILLQFSLSESARAMVCAYSPDMSQQGCEGD